MAAKYPLRLKVKARYDHLLPSEGYRKQYSEVPHKVVFVVLDGNHVGDKARVSLGDEASRLLEFDHERSPFELVINLHTVDLSGDPKLGAFCYCITWNESGAECLLRCGVAHFSLRDVLKGLPSGAKKGDALAMHRFEKESLKEFESEMARGGKYGGGKRYLKEGWLSLDFSILSFAGDSVPRLSLRRREEEKGQEEEEEGEARHMKDICRQGFFDIYLSRLRSRVAGVCEKIRCPEFLLPPKYLLPGGAYCLYGAVEGGVPESFFVHLKEAELINSGTTRETLRSWLSSREARRANHKKIGSFLVGMISRLAWSMQYISDFTNANRAGKPYKRENIDDTWNETFKNTFLTLSGDCEDLSWITYRMFEEFVRNEGKERYDDEDLQSMREFFGKHYVSLLCQCVASHANVRKKLEESKKRGQKISMGKGGVPKLSDSIDREEFMCHTTCLLMPKKTFVEAVRRSEKAYVESRSPVGPRWKEVKTALESMERDLEDGDAELGKILLPLFCEGTYPTHPFHPSHVTEEDKEVNRWVNYLYNKHTDLVDCFESEKHMESDPRSRFCKMFVRGFTGALHRYGLDSVNVCFTFHPDLEKHDFGLEEKRSELYYGAWSDEVLNPQNREEGEGFGLFFYCFMNDEEWRRVNRRMSNDQPTPTPQVPSFESLRHTVLYEMILSRGWLKEGGGGGRVGDNDFLVSHTLKGTPSTLTPSDTVASKEGTTRVSLYLKPSHAPSSLSSALELMEKKIKNDPMVERLEFSFVPVYDPVVLRLYPVYVVRFDAFFSSKKK